MGQIEALPYPSVSLGVPRWWGPPSGATDGQRGPHHGGHGHWRWHTVATHLVVVHHLWVSWRPRRQRGHVHPARRRRRHGVVGRPGVHVAHEGWRPLYTHGRQGPAGLQLLHSEVELQEELLCFFVPVSPKLVLRLVNLPAGDLKSNGLVWFCGQEQVLPATIWGLDTLLIGRHEAMPRPDALRDLWIVNLE